MKSKFLSARAVYLLSTSLSRVTGFLLNPTNVSVTSTVKTSQNEAEAEVKVERDRGTWIMDCAGAEGPCNNACFSIYCNLQPDVYRCCGDERENRLESGVRPDSPARYGYTRDLYTHGHLDDPTTDEWPMSSMKEGGAQASLRNVEKSQNSAHGAQFTQFKNGQAPEKHSCRIGDEPLTHEDFFRVRFDVSTVQNKEHVHYCIAGNPCQRPGHKYDPFDMAQFFMSKKGTGLKSKNPKGHSQYRLTTPQAKTVSGEFSITRRDEGLKGKGAHGEKRRTCPHG